MIRGSVSRPSVLALALLALAAQGSIGCSEGLSDCVPENDDALCREGGYCSFADVTDRCGRVRHLDCHADPDCP